MPNIQHLLNRLATGKRVLILFVVTNIVYGLMLLVTIPGTMVFSEGMKLLDMMPAGYTPDYVADLLDKLGEAGRRTYLTQQIPMDMIYPGLFALCYALLTAWLLKKLERLQWPYLLLSGLPVLAGLADYLENFGIIYLLRSYPELPDSAVRYANICTLVKSGATTVSFTVLIVLLLLLSVRWWRNRSKSPAESA